LKAIRFVRKPFVVVGVHITADNMVESARWCKGTILSEGDTTFIRVPSARYTRVEQTEARIGCWLVRSRYRERLVFKVYTDEQLRMMFTELEMDEDLESDALDIEIEKPPAIGLQQRQKFVRVS
jgi:hypothetical protein